MNAMRLARAFTGRKRVSSNNSIIPPFQYNSNPIKYIYVCTGILTTNSIIDN